MSENDKLVLLIAMAVAIFCLGVMWGMCISREIYRR